MRIVLFLSLLCCSIGCSSAPAKGLDEACQKNSDCVTSICTDVINGAGMTRMCTSGCSERSDCQKFDQQAICNDNTCMIPCNPNLPCPQGTLCAADGFCFPK